MILFRSLIKHQINLQPFIQNAKAIHSDCPILKPARMVLGMITSLLSLIVRSSDIGPQPEFAHPYEVLSPHFDLVVASPKGQATVLDPVSVELFKDDAYCVEFAETKQKLWLETQKLENFLGRAKEFLCIFYVGGFGRKALIPIFRRSLSRPC